MAPRILKTYRRIFLIRNGEIDRAGEVATECRRVLRELAVEPNVIRRAGIVCFEAEINIAVYSGRGRIILLVDDNEVEFVFSDRGPGIPDIELARKPGYSTAPDWARDLGFGAGMGIPNMEANADRLEIRSRVGGGTVIRAVFRRGQGDSQGRGGSAGA